MNRKLVSISLLLILLFTPWFSVAASDSSILPSSASLGGGYADAGGPYTGIVGIPIQFDGTQSHHPNETQVSYEWSCGDGHTKTGETPTHIYHTPGTYVIILTIKDNHNTCYTDHSTVTIMEDDPPEASFQTPIPGGIYFRNVHLFTTNRTTLIIGASEIRVEASDDVGIQRIEFYIDGERVHVDFNYPYSCPWEADTLTHTIKAIIYDTSGHDVSIEQTVFKWKIHPIVILKTLSLISNNNAEINRIDDTIRDFDGGKIQKIVLLSIVQGLFSTQKESDNVLASLIDHLLDNREENSNLYEYLNRHPLIRFRLQQRYPFIYRLIMISNGDLSNSESTSPSLFENHRLIKTMATLSIIKALYNATKTMLTADPTGIELFGQWVRSHPYLILFSSILIIQLIARLTNNYENSENDNFDEPSTNRIPHANPGGPYREEKGKPILFTADESYDEDGTIVSFIWDFGDGYSDSGEQVEHTYHTQGTYLVTLTVIDEDGAESNETTTVIISESSPLQSSGSQQEDMTFWIVSGGLSSIMALGIAAVTFRRRFFE